MEVVPSESAIKKSKRLTSVVWNHFERIKKADICYAICLHCNKRLSGSSNSGTTHLRNHLMRCLKRSNYDVSQLLTVKRRKKEAPISITNVGYDEAQRKEEYIKPAIAKFDHEHRRDDLVTLASNRFDQERSQQDLARMIILHGYPLSMVEHIGFRIFLRNLQPLFEVMPNSSIEISCMEIYLKEKQNVYEVINRLHGRLNLAVELWTSPENTEYLRLTANYIDDDWKLQKKILNFVTLDTYHSDDMLSEIVMKCLIEWDIECKLFALTFDDCSTDNRIVFRIKEQIFQNRPLLTNSQLFGVHSAGQVLCSIAHDAIEALREVTQKIRASIRYVKCSQITQGKFNEIVQQVGINSQKNLTLDSSPRWNTTYIMLESVLEYKSAFCVLQEQDSEYASALTDIEWQRASSISSYLKTFVEVTEVLCRNKCPTANIFFPEICDLHIQLIEWSKSSDEFVSSMASKMKLKFDRYWSKCSLALAMAAILDPRFKMKLVEYYYSQIYGSTALDRIKEVSDCIKELFNAYSICSTMVDQGSALPGSSLPSTGSDIRDRLKGFDKFLHETAQSQSIASDLDKYLDEPVFPRTPDLNILNWWKAHTPRYPILSMMARDVLGTPMSTISLESAYGTGSRMLDSYRSSLNADTRQALICARDWLQSETEEHSSFSPLAVYVEAA